MSEKRFKHSVNVAKAARWLAFKYGASEEKAVIAGILHDITKEWKTHDHMTFLHKYNIGITSYEYNSKKLYHAVTGSCFAKAVMKIYDLDILNAIRFHTTARAGMSTLEKVIYVADFISDDRSFSGVDRLRSLSTLSLDETVFAGLADTIKELSHDNSIIHPDTINAYNEYVMRIEKERNLRISDERITKFYKKSVLV